VSHLTRSEMSLVIWLNIITIVARSVRLMPAHMCEDVHATRQLHRQWWSRQCYAKYAENAASVHNITCLDKIVCYLQRIFKRNWKLKQQVSKLSALKLGVCSKIKVCYVFVWIFSRYAKTRTSNFYKVVQQHNDGIMRIIIQVLLEIYLAFQQWKNLENPLRIDKVIAVSLVYYFFWDTV